LLLRVGRLEARDFSRLRRRVSTLPWRELLPHGATLQVKASARRSRLFHTGAVEETIRYALIDSVSRATRGPLGPPGGPVTVLARGEDDRWTLSIDSSGPLLHRRGWRLETAQAPLRETLAAALVLLCEWDPATPLVDPMCGAGTLPIEAAAIALQHAPGLGRSFAFEHWPCFKSEAWERERAAAKAALRSELPAPVLGFDRSPSAVASARRNAVRAGVAHLLHLEELALAELRAPRLPRRPGSRAAWCWRTHPTVAASVTSGAPALPTPSSVGSCVNASAAGRSGSSPPTRNTARACASAGPSCTRSATGECASSSFASRSESSGLDKRAAVH